MLPSQPSEVIDMNEAGLPVVGIDRPFFVGSDGGEERYLVDTSNAESPVYVYELETGHDRVLVDSWEKYVDHIRDTLLSLTLESRPLNAKVVRRTRREMAAHRRRITAGMDRPPGSGREMRQCQPARPASTAAQENR